jgi:tRNA dimethylallyltransferase
MGGHVALLGPTAAGKSALAVELARCRPRVEIVSVDSMSVYRGMDIGTAKPTAAVRAEVPHHLLDLVGPEEEFTVRRFQAAARQAIGDIEARGGRALLVGGTGLYLRAVVDDLELPGRYPDVVAELEAEAARPGGLDALFDRLRTLDPVAAGRMNAANQRRVVRALEVTVGSGRPFSSFGPGLETYPPTAVTMAGIPFVAAVHDPRIEARFDELLGTGLVDEVRALAAAPGGLSRTARQALGYREVLAHLEEGVPLDTARQDALRRTKAFARRQWAWFRRDPRIHWLDPAGDLLAQLLGVWDAAGRAEGRTARGPGGTVAAGRAGGDGAVGGWRHG